MRRSSKTPWLLLIIGTGFVALTAWSVYRAAQGTSAVTDPAYYSHGLRYNETLLEEKAAATLGWSVKTRLEDENLLILLRDKQGQPVRGANGSLSLHAGSAAPNRTLRLTEQQHGLYAVRLPEALHGEVSADLSFERDGARLNKRLLLALD